jgi:hypothetical protein
MKQSIRTRTYPDVEALLPVVGQGDLRVELDGDSLAVVAAFVVVLVPGTATEAAVEGAAAERRGDHLDVGSGSHQGRAPAAPPDAGREGGEEFLALLFAVVVLCAPGGVRRARDEGGGVVWGKGQGCLPWLVRLAGATVNIVLLRGGNGSDVDLIVLFSYLFLYFINKYRYEYEY